jgi:hypothetical protein
VPAKRRGAVEPRVTVGTGAQVWRETRSAVAARVDALSLHHGPVVEDLRASDCRGE